MVRGVRAPPTVESWLAVIRSMSSASLRMHFVRTDEIEAAWRLFDRLIAAPPPVRAYAAGTWGPVEADELATACDGAWHNP